VLRAVIVSPVPLVMQVLEALSAYFFDRRFSSKPATPGTGYVYSPGGYIRRILGTHRASFFLQLSFSSGSPRFYVLVQKTLFGFLFLHIVGSLGVFLFFFPTPANTLSSPACPKSENHLFFLTICCYSPTGFFLFSRQIHQHRFAFVFFPAGETLHLLPIC